MGPSPTLQLTYRNLQPLQIDFLGCKMMKEASSGDCGYGNARVDGDGEGDDGDRGDGGRVGVYANGHAVMTSPVQ